MDKRDKTITVYIVLGFVSLFLAFGLISLVGLKIGLILLGVITLLIGFVKYEESGFHPAIQALMLVAPFGLVMGMALNGVIHLFVMGVIAIVGSLVGVYIRFFLWNRRFVFCGILLVFHLIFIFLIGVNFLPSHYNRTSWEEKKFKAATYYRLLKPNNETLHSVELKGKVLVMDFWATWCGPCKAQFPVLEQLHKKYKGDNRIVFLCIHCSRRKNDNIEKIQAFIADSKFKLTFMIDPKDEVMKKFDVGVLPTVVMVDAEGTVRYEHTGYTEAEDFFEECSKRIDLLLKKQ